MIIEQVENPKITGTKENIVKITMTVDQFHMLNQCIKLAWQTAEENSRMFEITNLIHSDFENLKRNWSEHYI